MRLSGSALAAMAGILLATSAGAITSGQTDSFEDGSTQGWGSGAANPAPPVNVTSGGPAGADDNYLLVAASGIHGPGGKLVALNELQWTGDYIAAGVTGLTMDLNNLGGTALSLRLYLLGGPGQTALSLDAVQLPAASGWTHVFFDLSPAALAGAPLATLAGVTQLRLFHSVGAAYPGPDVAAMLGVDNISAVAEPGPASLLAAGLAVLAALAARRRRRQA